MDRGAWRATVHGVTTDTTEQAFLHCYVFAYFAISFLQCNNAVYCHRSIINSLSTLPSALVGGPFPHLELIFRGGRTTPSAKIILHPKGTQESEHRHLLGAETSSSPGSLVSRLSFKAAVLMKISGKTTWM